MFITTYVFPSYLGCHQKILRSAEFVECWEDLTLCRSSIYKCINHKTKTTKKVLQKLEKNCIDKIPLRRKFIKLTQRCKQLRFDSLLNSLVSFTNRYRMCSSGETSNQRASNKAEAAAPKPPIEGGHTAKKGLKLF